MDINTVKNITNGAYNIYSEDDAVYFERFSKRQKEAYAENGGLRVRSLCASGICFDFVTDSAYVKVGYKVMSRARDFGYFDLYIDNIFVESIGDDCLSDGTVKFKIPKDGCKEHRVTIYLPHLSELGIIGFETEENASVIPVKKEEKLLLCLGDSITQGMDAKYPSSPYPVQLARELNMELLNQGVGGYVYNGKSVDKDLNINPDLITVAYGTNDWNVCKGRDEFSENTDNYFKALTSVYDTKITYVITPIWRFDIDNTMPLGSFNDLVGIITEKAVKYGIKNIINGIHLVPNDIKYFAGDTNVHPSDLGFMYYFKNLLRYTKSNIKMI